VQLASSYPLLLPRGRRRGRGIILSDTPEKRKESMGYLAAY